MPDLPARADPIRVDSADECFWYHTFAFPDDEVVQGDFDLRDTVDDYLGRYDFAGKRVLEIGPASGFLTAAMEQRGASVVCVDTSDEQIWDFVPRLDRDMEAFLADRAIEMNALRKSWWYSQKKTGGKARVHYIGADNVTAALGRFDCGLVAAVLRHVKTPYDLLRSLADICDDLIVTEQYLKRIEHQRPLAEFIPGPDNDSFESWWHLSSGAVDAMMATLGFERKSFSVGKHRKYKRKRKGFRKTFFDHPFFTAVYTKTKAPAAAAPPP